LPPALSPPTANCFGFILKTDEEEETKVRAEKQSSTAAGNGASGALRYSTENTAQRAPLHSVRQTTSCVSRSPITQPPPWM
jgi:hypothetical protein